MAIPSIRVDSQTTVKELQQFAKQAGDDAKIRGKQNKDGSITLYASTKKGSGFKNWAFGTRANRQNNARNAIATIFSNMPRRDSAGGKSQLGVALSNINKSLQGGEIKGSDLKHAVTDAKVAFNKANRPVGMTVANDGTVSGSSILKQTEMDQDGGKVIKPLDVALVETAQSLKKIDVVDGVEINAKANDDMPRMHLDIQGYKTMGPPGGDGEAMKAKKADNAKKLHDFAGSDKATKVLSSCCNQYMLRRFEAGLQRGNGDPTSLLLANKGNKNPYTHVDSNGISHDVGRPPQYAGAQFELGKYDNGDFKLNVTWDLYAQGFTDPGAGQWGKDKHYRLPLPKDQVIKTTMTAEIRINKADADKGELSLSLEGPAQMTFDGKVTPPKDQIADQIQQYQQEKALGTASGGRKVMIDHYLPLAEEALAENRLDDALGHLSLIQMYD